MNNVNFQKISLFKTPDESLGFLLWRISTQWRGDIEDILKPLGLTHPQFVVLATTGWLTKKGERVSQVAIGRTAGLDPNTTSQILRGLEKKKFIKRVRSADERTKHPVLTALGSGSLSKALPCVEQADATFFDRLSKTELHTLMLLFQKLM